MGKYRLEIVVFITGACVMALEIIGSRIVAPYLGTSVIVWTSLIGVVLASLSFGYYLGGKLADKRPEEKILANIIAASSIYVALSAIFKDPNLLFIQKNISDLRSASIFAVFLVLFVPSFLLGMVSPFAVRLAIGSVKGVGKTAGNLYAISTFGSIVGTFLAGFILISLLGHTNILLLTAAFLLVASIFALGRINTAHLVLVGILVVCYLTTNKTDRDKKLSGFFDIDTLYNRVQIYKARDPINSKEIKAMVFDPKFVQSAMYLDSDDLVFNVYKHFKLANYFKTDIASALMIGGAAYTYPMDFLKNNPSSKLDVVEIDPGLTALAREHFRLKDDKRLTIYHEDARRFLETEVGVKKYDVIFEDAFSSASSVPFQLTTKEAIQNMHLLLSDDGVVMVNVISAIDGDKGKFLQALYKTYKEVFPHVYVLPINSQNTHIVQNILVIALKSRAEPSFTSGDPVLSGYLAKIYKGDLSSSLPILDDNFAPVDEYLIGVIDN